MKGKDTGQKGLFLLRLFVRILYHNVINVKKIVENLLSDKSKTVPVLSFPSSSLLGITVQELISDCENQALGMKAIADRCNIGALLNMMDLSVEAEAFGARVSVSSNEIPTVAGRLIEDADGIAALKVPEIGAGRTGIYIDGIRRAKEMITDIPVFCGVIGPYSLAGRLFDMTELMMACYDEPETVSELLEKCTEFITKYISAFKAAGADGVIIAEPVAGLLSPQLCAEFSTRFVRRIIEDAGDDEFVVVYHNCGNIMPLAADLVTMGADIYHFGNSVELSEIIPLFPSDTVVMGNLDPILFRNSDADTIKAKTTEILNKCSQYPNFMMSSGCDIPYDAKWENLDAYFAEVKEFYI